ncbi:MAG: hypothetical protein ACTHMS_15400 [Jatrophihabitans sp.]|uniref:hypothetical protein n=1 Tax=Jatrophihabitans sp. TaxID=1932789 RepID=UPI003F7D5A9B
MTDPRAAVIARIPAVDLRPGDLVDTSTKDNDYQEVLAVYRTPSDVPSGDAVEDADALRNLLQAADGNYVVVQLTDLAPVDYGVIFEDGVAMAAGEDEEQPVAEVLSDGSGRRTYVYTKYELVTVRER